MADGAIEVSAPFDMSSPVQAACVVAGLLAVVAGLGAAAEATRVPWTRLSEGVFSRVGAARAAAGHARPQAFP